MRADALLNQLKNVKPRGQGQYMARCPAHNDKTASLSVKCCDDGRVLLHCFAGCEPDAILGAVGLEFSHLFPDRVTDHAPPVRQIMPAADILRILEREVMVIAIIASDILEHREMSQETWERLAKAANRVNTMRGYIS
jgi:hypothetical protein